MRLSSRVSILGVTSSPNRITESDGDENPPMVGVATLGISPGCRSLLIGPRAKRISNGRPVDVPASYHPSAIPPANSPSPIPLPRSNLNAFF